MADTTHAIVIFDGNHSLVEVKEILASTHPGISSIDAISFAGGVRELDHMTIIRSVRQYRCIQLGKVIIIIWPDNVFYKTMSEQMIDAQLLETRIRMIKNGVSILTVEEVVCR